MRRVSSSESIRIENLRATQKKGLNINAMPYALGAILYKGGVALVGRMCMELPWERFETFKSRKGGAIPAPSEWSSLPG
jgi:hypothetical protein